MRRSKTVDVVACHVYGHPKWEHIERGFEGFERIEPLVATGVARLGILAVLVVVVPFVRNLLEWRAQ